MNLQEQQQSTGSDQVTSFDGRRRKGASSTAAAKKLKQTNSDSSSDSSDGSIDDDNEGTNIEMDGDDLYLDGMLDWEKIEMNGEALAPKLIKKELNILRRLENVKKSRKKEKSPTYYYSKMPERFSTSIIDQFIAAYIKVTP